MLSVGPVLSVCEAPGAWPGHSFSVSRRRFIKFCALETRVHRDSLLNGFSESNV